MPVIHYHEWPEYAAGLQTPDRLTPAPASPLAVYLIFGDEYLCESVLKELLSSLLPDPGQRLNRETFRGDALDIFEVIEQLNTFSLLAGPKVVVIQEAQVFNPAMAQSADDARALANAVKKGFPDNHYLILTAENIDKRRTLYQVIKDMGVIIDCTVPGGDRAADRKVQESVLAEQTRKLLSSHGKTMAPGVFQMLVGLTGFELRTHVANLEKLITYTADRSEITEADVRTLLKRTRRDPIYELTGAVSDRNVEKALFYLKSLQNAGMHPLQMLTALINQFRKLLLMKGFASSGRKWPGNMSYNAFTKDVLPAIKAYDDGTRSRLEAWEPLAGSGKTDSGQKTKKIPADLLIAGNARNPYPLYLLFRKTESFTYEELVNTFECLHEADLRLKTTGDNPEIVLETVIYHICRGGKYV